MPECLTDETQAFHYNRHHRIIALKPLGDVPYNVHGTHQVVPESRIVLSFLCLPHRVSYIDTYKGISLRSS